MQSLDQVISVSGLTFPIYETKRETGRSRFTYVLHLWRNINSAVIIHIRFYYLAFQQYITFRGNTEVKVLDKVRTWK